MPSLHSGVCGWHRVVKMNISFGERTDTTRRHGPTIYYTWHPEELHFYVGPPQIPDSKRSGMFRGSQQSTTSNCSMGVDQVNLFEGPETSATKALWKCNMPCTLRSHLETNGHVHQISHQNVEYSCPSATYHIFLSNYLLDPQLKDKLCFHSKNILLRISERLDQFLHHYTHSIYLRTRTHFPFNILPT
jgi:hypothetical protein